MNVRMGVLLCRFPPAAQTKLFEDCSIDGARRLAGVLEQQIHKAD
jgi:hypothetical protein